MNCGRKLTAVKRHLCTGNHWRVHFFFLLPPSSLTPRSNWWAVHFIVSSLSVLHTNFHSLVSFICSCEWNRKKNKKRKEKNKQLYFFSSLQSKMIETWIFSDIGGNSLNGSDSALLNFNFDYPSKAQKEENQKSRLMRIHDIWGTKQARQKLVPSR